ncbi:recombinase family protein [Bacillus toyonensis]|uniref:recombinase family protein n=1 Tax=Bacillus toyonensis TaxID=155322 RepID=UPI001FF85F1D|nr:recombinase family protein [Bacillus toyonensis]
MNRLARSLKHMLELVENLEKRNVHIVSLDYNFDARTATGKILFHIIGAVAEWERELLKEKQRAGVDIAKKRVGSWGGLVSMGKNMRGWNMLSIHIKKVNVQ